MTRLAVAMTPDRFADVCDPATERALESSFEVVRSDGDLGGAAVTRLLADADVVLTSWGSPRLTEETLGERVRVVAHAAGTVKNLLDPALLESRLTVFSAAPRIAWSVGEYCLAALLTQLRRLPEFDDSIRAGRWRPEGLRGRELRGRRVALIGASSTARCFIELLRPFQPELVVYDPYLSAEAAAALGVTPVGLADAMDSEVVSIHVPNVPATQGMITAELLARVPDGGIVINSARAASVDLDALDRELRSGRLRAALDVFEVEPLAVTPPGAGAGGVLYSPHVAGDTIEGHRALVGYVMDDVRAFLADGSRGQSYVDPSVWSIAA